MISALWRMSSGAVVCILTFSVCVSSQDCSDLKFPPGVKLGAATSSYQIEGAWNAGEKGESVWDRWVRQQPSPVVDGSNGDVACDSYNLWERDIEMARELGLDFYRFSVSWPRILPTGFTNKVNKDGVEYYNRLINDLLKNGIEPVITMYHFELPQRLQDLGGWTNPLIVDWFSAYAQVLYSLFADRVTTWITINEPLMVCDMLYTTGILAPSILELDVAPYLCNRHVLLAHARAFRLYDQYKHINHGKMSIAINPVWLEPATANDTELAELGRQFGAGRYSHPIYSATGGWPPAVEKVMEEHSRRSGYSQSNLPPFTEEEIKLIRGTYDFYALNHYTTMFIRPAKPGETPGFWPFAGSTVLDAVLFNDPEAPVTPQGLAVVPEGIRLVIAWIREQYGDVDVFISENGMATTGDVLHDTERIQFIRKYLEQVLLSIIEDGADVIGYTVWALMDNFEWASGYTLKFGLYHVNFTEPGRTRTARDSARYFAYVAKNRVLGPVHDTP